MTIYKEPNHSLSSKVCGECILSVGSLLYILAGSQNSYPL